MAEPASIPVHILTGFLGSGKTTLLSRLVRDPAFHDTAVIVNEFGEIGLDHVLINRSEDRDVVLLDSGCLCCASDSPLQETLESLWYRRARGEVPPFARAVVETSGLANPVPLVADIHGLAVGGHFRLGGVAAVFDSVNGPSNLKRFDEVMRQLSIADCVGLSKADLVTQEELQAVKEQVAAINPHANVVVLGSGNQADSTIFSDSGLARIEASGPAGTPQGSRLSHLLRNGIGSHVFRLQNPVDWASYASWVRLVQQRLGDRLLRAKGVLKFTDGELRLIQGVGCLFATPQTLSFAIPQQQTNAMVMITSNATGEEVLEVAHALGDVVAGPQLRR